MPLNIISYNCKGFKHRNYPYIKKMYNKCDILLIQELWLYSSESSIIYSVLPDSDFYFKSSMCDDEFVLGRPYGGVGIIYKKNRQFLIKPVDSKSNRISAIDCSLGQLKLLIFSVYMPSNVRENNEEFFEVLYEITSICNLYPDYQLVIGGDFNTTLTGNNLRNNFFLDFLSGFDLICPNSIDPINLFTFYNNQGHKSLIDHFCISSNVSDLIVEYEILSDGDNLSDHNPIFINFEITTSSVMQGNAMSYSPKCKLPDWNNASDSDITLYKYNLDINLSSISIPLEAVVCNDFNCNKHYNVFNDYFYKIYQACVGATNSSIRNIRGLKSKKGLLGWNKYVKSYRDSAILWHNIWKENGSPDDGTVFNIRKMTRKKYHDQLNNLRNKQNLEKQLKLKEYIDGNKSKDFWKCINSIKAGSSSAPSLVDGATGMNACNIFRNKFSKLYQSESGSSLSDICKENEINISNFCKTNDKACSHLHNTNIKQIKSAINKLNSNNNETNSVLSTNALKNGTDFLCLHLSFMLTIMIRHGYSNTVFNTVTFTPLIKNERKNKNISDNYRAIALNSMFSKILDYIILEYFKSELKSSIFQFAYKKNFSTSLCSFLMKETIEYYINNNSNVYATFLDCSKAFDLVKHNHLFEILMNRGLCPIIIRLLINLYDNMKGKVKWNFFISERFDVYNGVKQGGVLSPSLFSLYMDELIKLIHNTGVGCYVGDIPSAVFIYADDIVLLTPNRFSMNKLLKICEKYGQEYGLKFNSSKSECMFFSKKSSIVDHRNFILNNVSIKFVSKCKHLGHLLASGDCSFLVDPIIYDMKAKTNGILNSFNYVSADIRMKLFNSFCSSYYGAVLCNLNDVHAVDVAWRICARKILNISCRSRSYLLPALVNTLNARSEIEKRVLLFFVNGLNHQEETIRNFFNNCFINFNSTMSSNINSICRKYNFNNFKINMYSRNFIKSFFKNRTPDDWRISMIKELLLVRDGQLIVNNYEKSDVLNILEHLCTF